MKELFKQFAVAALCAATAAVGTAAGTFIADKLKARWTPKPAQTPARKVRRARR